MEDHGLILNNNSSFFNLMKYFIFLSLLVLSCSSNKEISDSSNIFNEAYRPQFHFTPEVGWMNDPNGMYFYEGEYNLFYQHFPDDNVWGPMHWGHAKSKDLIHWEHMPIAIYPDGNNYIFSGSAIVDYYNKSGLGSLENPPIISFYTNHDMYLERRWNDNNDSIFINVETQHIAYSNDKGLTWQKYDKNPVIPNTGFRDFRDPKVTWSDEYQRWYITLAARDRILFYESYNLLDWKLISEFSNYGEMNGVWECPDLFPLIDDDGNKKWILFISINKSSPNGGSGTQYVIGDFDGKNFIADSNFLGDEESVWIDYGSDNYAGVSWNNTTSDMKSRIFIGWMSNWEYGEVVPTYKWRSSMTLPREMTLYKTNERYRLRFSPISLEPIEVEKYSGSIKNLNDLHSQLNRVTLSDINSDDFEILLSNDNERIVIKKNKGDIIIDRSKFLTVNDPINKDSKRDIPLSVFIKKFIPIQRAKFDKKVNKLDLVIDKTSLELFFNDGELVMTDIFFFKDSINGINFKGLEGSNLSHKELVSIW